VTRPRRFLSVPCKVKFIQQVDAFLSDGALLVVLQELILLALLSNLRMFVRQGKEGVMLANYCVTSHKIQKEALKPHPHQLTQLARRGLFAYPGESEKYESVNCQDEKDGVKHNTHPY